METGTGTVRDEKRKNKESHKMCGQVKRRIEKYMYEEQLSPEQIVGLYRKVGYQTVGKTSIYNYIHKKKQSGWVLWEN